MSFVAVSPHLDDAVLSFGGALGVRRSVAQSTTVLTVLAGTPPAWTWPTPFDNASGFSDSREAAVARRDEDLRACSSLGMYARHLPFLDGQYGIPQDPDEIVEALVHELQDAEGCAVPLGLLHPDHRLVAKCCRAALAKLDGGTFIVYADLPAATMAPSHLPGALRGWERAGWRLTPYVWPVRLERKQDAWAEYASQQSFVELAWENLTEEFGWLATYSD